MILLKDRLKRSGAGYARTFLRQLEEVLGDVQGARHQDRRQRRRPQSRRARRGGARALRAARLRAMVAHIEGDDLMPTLAALQQRGEPLTHLDKGIPLSALRDAGADRQRVSRRLGHRGGARPRRRSGHLPARHRRGADARPGGVDASAGRATTGTASPPASSPVTSSSAARSAPAATTPSSTRCRGSTHPGFPIAEMHADGSLRHHQARRAPAAWSRVGHRHGAAALRDRRRRAIRTPTSPRASTPSASSRRARTACCVTRRAGRAAAADHEGLHQLLRRLQELDDLRARPASTSRRRRALAEETLWKLVGGRERFAESHVRRCVARDRAEPGDATRTPSRTSRSA